MSDIIIRFYGALGDCVPGSELKLKVPAGITAADLKRCVAEELQSRSAIFDPEILRVSALGTDEKVLRDGDQIGSGQFFALLPPVCGG